MDPLNHKHALGDVERELHEANEILNEVVAQTPEAVRELEVMFGSTDQEVPAELRDSRAVLARIKEQENARRTPSEFGKLIRLLRTEKRLTLEELAQKTDLEREDIEDVETSFRKRRQPNGRFGTHTVLSAEYSENPTDLRPCQDECWH